MPFDISHPHYNRLSEFKYSHRVYKGKVWLLVLWCLEVLDMRGSILEQVHDISRLQLCAPPHDLGVGSPQGIGPVASDERGWSWRQVGSDIIRKMDLITGINRPEFPESKVTIDWSLCVPDDSVGSPTGYSLIWIPMPLEVIPWI